MNKDEMIFDRDGNKVRIFVKNDEEIKELSRSQFNLMFESIKKKPYVFPFYLLSLKDLITIGKSQDKGLEIRKVIFQRMLKMKKEPKYVILETRNKRVNLLFDSQFMGFFLLIKEIFLNNQYDIDYNNIKNKVIIDAGANIGLFSIYAAALGAKRVYAFEPIPETYKTLQENIKLNNLEKMIVPINKGLGEKKKTEIIYYGEGGDLGATINPLKIKHLKEKIKKKNLTIEITTVDRFVKENKIKGIDFIKMDVEGYEENVLLGAKETIKKWKPILSFSAYHLPTDKERLPKIVKSIRPDYKIKLHQYGSEDFYCW